MSVQFDGRVAIVTGAGNGIGRAHAIELAKRGAKVVVNDLGGTTEGNGGSLQAAESVVAEIEAAGGEAIADGASVTDDAAVERMVQRTLDTFGRIDIVVNNAGVCRDKTLSNLAIDDFEFVMDVHLMGTVKVTKACWPHLKKQRYGRVIVTSSPVGFYGNFGNSNYNTAKAAVLGFMHSIRLEGAKDNIRANALAPMARTRLTERFMPKDQFAVFAPEYVAPGAMCLLDEDAPSGAILIAGGGYFALIQYSPAQGVALPREGLTAEKVRANWATISDFSKSKPVYEGTELTEVVFKMIGLA